MAEAAAIVEGSGADLLDINFGCAVKKVIKTGSGVALMRTPQRAEELLRAVRHAVRIPLTIKIRSGWDGSGRQALALGEIAEACGVNAVTVHPRTASQKFSGRADWGVIAALKRQLSIPVIGNGDIACADDAARMLFETGCDAVMVGRRAIGYPRIFTEIGLRLHGKAVPADTIAQPPQGPAALYPVDRGVLRTGNRYAVATAPPGLVCQRDAKRCRAAMRGRADHLHGAGV